MNAPRSFTDAPARRQAVPLWVGLVGPSGSGKTFSALRLATGMQRVNGGDIFFIDTEAGRSLHYAEQFAFKYVKFVAPFNPQSYIDAINHCVAKGAKTIIIDSFTHEWSGEGGVLDMQIAEVERMAGKDSAKADRVKMAAWIAPKREHKALLSRMLQIPCNFVLCYRAKEKIKPQTGGTPLSLGWMPDASDDFVFEATVNMLLYPNSGGVPAWSPSERGEQAVIKLPEQFKKIFAANNPLSEETGEALAKWAAGTGDTFGAEDDSDALLQDLLAQLSTCEPAGAVKIANEFSSSRSITWTAEQKAQVVAAIKSAKERAQKPRKPWVEWLSDVHEDIILTKPDADMAIFTRVVAYFIKSSGQRDNEKITEAQRTKLHAELRTEYGL